MHKLSFSFYIHLPLLIFLPTHIKKNKNDDNLKRMKEKEMAKGVVPARSGAYMIHSLQRAILQPYQCSEFSLLYCYPRALPQY